MDVETLQHKQIIAMRKPDPLGASYWSGEVKHRIMLASQNEYLTIFQQRAVTHARRLMCLVYIVEGKNKEYYDQQIEKFEIVPNKATLKAIEEKNCDALVSVLVKQVHVFRERVSQIIAKNQFSSFDFLAGM